LVKNLADNQLRQAALMGNSGATDAARATQATAYGSENITPTALAQIVQRADATSTALEKYNTGLNKYIEKSGTYNGPIHARQFKSAWAENYDPRIFMVQNVLDSNMSQAEKTMQIKHIQHGMTAEEKKKLAEEQQRKQEEAAAAEQRARKRREEIQRLNQMAGDGGAGDAEKSQGPRGDNSYARTVAGLIKSHTILPQNDIAGNPAVEFLIELQPDGGLRGEPKMTKSSGIAAFDQAVKRAIEKSTPFPPDPSTGKVPVNINITHRLKDSDTR
jgi:TonB family protein